MTVVLDVSAAIEILLQKEKKDLFNDPYCQSWTRSPYADFLVA